MVDLFNFVNIYSALKKRRAQFGANFFKFIFSNNFLYLVFYCQLQLLYIRIYYIALIYSLLLNKSINRLLPTDRCVNVLNYSLN